MSQATSIEQEKPKNHEGIRLPIDGLIEWNAHQIDRAVFGGGKEREIVRFLKFAFVGTLGAIIDVGISNMLFATVLPPVNEIGDVLLINTIIAATISFIVAITSNFFWNRYWTYPDSRSRSLAKQLMLFAFICTVGWLGRAVWLTFATEPLTVFVQNNAPLDTQLAGQLGASLAVFLAIFVVMIWNFAVNRLWTFNDVE